MELKKKRGKQAKRRQFAMLALSVAGMALAAVAIPRAVVLAYNGGHSEERKGRLLESSSKPPEKPEKIPKGFPALGARDRDTTTPIKHVIIVIGENRSFDNLFATYVPSGGQQILNLLSEGIVNADGTAGPNYVESSQWQATDTTTFELAPAKTSLYSTLPRPNTTYAPLQPWAVENPVVYPDPGLLPDAEELLLIGGTGLPDNVPDTRFPDNLANEPFQITDYVSYSAYTGDPVHRFFQMWQQSDCSVQNVTASNPSGCLHDLYTWVAGQIGTGSNGLPPPSPFTSESTDQGAVQMGFYNMAAGDAPYLASLAGQYGLSDNYHQAIMGGTGANHVAIGTGSEVFYSDAQGNPSVPPANEIENPNPLSGTNDWYQQDGYSGGSFVDCADSSQPGVSPILDYLAAVANASKPNCASNTYYLVNNYNPGFHRDGTPYTSGFYVPPSTVPTIADELSAKRISWAYFGEGFHSGTPRTNLYCNICNPFQYATSIMTTHLRNNIMGLSDFYQAVQSGKLPAVSYVKPDELLDGHPASGKPELFEGFVQKLVDAVHKQPKLWANTAIFVTFDESGGEYDSGYIQPLDFFGDGARTVLLAVSRFAKPGYVNHDYADHVSLLKFIEANWRLRPLSKTSRDNLPNPVASSTSPYVPTNGPAISDLMSMFDFEHPHDNRS